jgi:hypothetical protein
MGTQQRLHKNLHRHTRRVLLLLILFLLVLQFSAGLYHNVFVWRLIWCVVTQKVLEWYPRPRHWTTHYSHALHVWLHTIILLIWSTAGMTWASACVTGLVHQLLGAYSNMPISVTSVQGHPQARLLPLLALKIALLEMGCSEKLWFFFTPVNQSAMHCRSVRSLCKSLRNSILVLPPKRRVVKHNPFCRKLPLFA